MSEHTLCGPCARLPMLPPIASAPAPSSPPGATCERCGCALGEGGLGEGGLVAGHLHPVVHVLACRHRWHRSAERVADGRCAACLAK